MESNPAYIHHMETYEHNQDNLLPTNRSQFEDIKTMESILENRIENNKSLIQTD